MNSPLSHLRLLLAGLIACVAISAPSSGADDLPLARVRVMAATQRPITDVAGNELSGEPAWKTVPSWFIYGSADHAIAPELHAFMANRANGRRIEVVAGASHVVMISHPNEVAKMVIEAASAASASQIANNTGS